MFGHSSQLGAQDRAIDLGLHALLALACALASALAAAADKVPEVPQRECARILAVAASLYPGQAGKLRCTLHERSAHYTVVGVHSLSPAPQGYAGTWTGSGLIGYFGLHRPSGHVQEWDMGENRPRARNKQQLRAHPGPLHGAPERR